VRLFSQDEEVVTHIAELLGIDDGENALWHPYECYIRPALLDDRTHTGDIFQLDERLWVVLTPQCDMANDNVSEILLAAINLGRPDWDAMVGDLGKGGLSNKRVEARDKYFRRLINQNIEVSQHFLPPLQAGPPLMVQFTELAMRPLAELNASLGAREASVAPAFLPNLIQRFGAYMSRTGQPDIAARHFA
jgi:hypothetical protein